MIACIQTESSHAHIEVTQENFLSMLPQIRRQAKRAFRHLDHELREELTAEAVAFAYCAFVRLVRQGRQALAFPTPLAQFAVRRVRCGRTAGSRGNRNDVLSPQARSQRGFSVERLDLVAPETGVWRQLLAEDPSAGPAATAAARIDIAAWLRTLSKRNRRIAKALAVGERSSDVAKQFGLSCGRISQLRNWFHQHWQAFQGKGKCVGSKA
jgi:hypothetical protein